MGQCIIKDCGFENQKSSITQSKNLRSFLTERIKERNNLRNQDIQPEDTIESEGILSTERPLKLRISTILGDIKEEEREEEDDTSELKEIKSLRMLPESYETYNCKSNFYQMKANQEIPNACYDNENEENKQFLNQKTKKIHNNLRVFLTKEQDLWKSHGKNGENDNLLASLALTNNGKGIYSSSNLINSEVFLNENFKKDMALTNDDSFEETKEKYAQIFTDDDYSEVEETHRK